LLASSGTPLLALRESTSGATARIAGLMVNSIQEYEQQTSSTRAHNRRLPQMIADQVKGG
jgi:hypothetical protein